MIIYAPYPFVEDAIILPNPLLANQEQTQHERDYRIMMDSTITSYVKRATKKIHIFSFSMSRRKASEFENFINEKQHEMWRIVDHNNNDLFGYILTNPLTLSFDGKYTENCNSTSYSENERVTFEIEFEA